MKKALAIDIGGTKISYGIINDKGEFLSEINKVETPKTALLIEEKLKKIVNLNKNKESNDSFNVVAIATAGTVNNENTKVIGSTANLPCGYRDINFLNLSNKKVFLENDANCAAWAEYRIGSSRGFDNSIMLTLGTGVGAGIIINGKLLKGKSGAAGEMHFRMSKDNKRQCTCGQYDCFEIYASGNGLRLTGAEIFKNKDITTYDIVELAQKNDKNALLALSTWQKDIALGIIGLQNIFDSECFVLSGSMEKFVDVSAMEDYVNQNIITSKTKIFHAKAGNYSGMIGAALLALETKQA